MAISAAPVSLFLPWLSSPSRPLLFSKASYQVRRRSTVRNPSSLRCNALLSDLAPATAAAYGTLLLGGGLFAYARSGSRGSIFGGASGAALMGLAYYLLQSSETKDIGEAIGFGAAFLFSCVFGIRLAATRKFVPSGILLSVSVGALAVFFSAYMQTKA